MKALHLAALLGLALAAPAADVGAILATPRQRIEQADYRATGQLVRVDASGARTSYAVTLKAHGFPGVLRVLMEITSPASARAHILFEMRTDGHSTIEIAHPGDKAPAAIPFDKWSDGPLGPGFSYEDFLESQYFWPGQAELEPVKYGARDCNVIKSTPGAAERTHYTQVKTWLDKTIGFPVYVEKSLKGSGAVKEFTYFGLRHTGGVWSASQVEAKLRGQAGSTLLIVDRGSAQANLTLKDFSPAQLVHFQDAK
jgi:Outer membrane lipoprotein-sorting protein